ncbi:MAG TPA: hypothetical protein VLM85_14435 [Polyangiaceae bacterium]|nr:hypothetical protein [Polyangiaceae bacterium]
MSVDKKRETPFDVAPERLFQAVLRYLRENASYTNTRDAAATMEVKTELHPGFFAYNGDVHFTISPTPSGSLLAVEVHTGPLFVIDWLSFWDRYLVHVTEGVRSKL